MDARNPNESCNYGTAVEQRMLKSQRAEEKRRDAFFRSKPITRTQRKRMRSR